MLNYSQHLARIAYLSGIPEDKQTPDIPAAIRMHELALQQDMDWTQAEIYRGVFEIGRMSAIHSLAVTNMGITHLGGYGRTRETLVLEAVEA